MNTFYKKRALSIMAMLLIGLAESFGQKSVTITPNCSTNTLTIMGSFNGQATSRCNGLIFKDNQLVATTGELPGPTIIQVYH